MAARTPKPPSVLVVDDNDDLRLLYTRQLARSGFNTVDASNGVEALQRAIEAVPDVVVLDLQMPAMDGLETLRRLKADPRTAHASVIVLTGSGTADQRAAVEAGCSAYLLKPVPSGALARAVLGFAHAAHAGRGSAA